MEVSQWLLVSLVRDGVEMAVPSFDVEFKQARVPSFPTTLRYLPTIGTTHFPLFRKYLQSWDWLQASAIHSLAAPSKALSRHHTYEAYKGPEANLKMAPRRSVAHRAAVPAVPAAANTASPRDLLIGFQLRRENRALYDTMEALRAQAVAELEAQNVRQAELERRIELAQQENHQLREAVRNQGEHVEELGEKVQRSETTVQQVVQQLSSGMLSGKFTLALLKLDREYHANKIFDRLHYICCR